MATSTKIGARVKRKEDPRLMTGSATYVDDIKLPGMVYAAFVRSPHAHARIKGINLAKARAVPGVVAALSGADLKGDFKNPLPCAWAAWDNLKNPPHWPLAVDEARYVGEPVAVVVHEDRYAARDAAALVEVEWEPLPVVAEMEEALQPGAPKVHAGLADNVSFTFPFSTQNFDAALGSAPVRIKQRYVQQRISGAPIEPCAALAEYRRHTGELTLWSASQAPTFLQFFTSGVLGVPEHQVRVIIPEVGGGFGNKLQVYSEEVTVAALAMRLGRPVKYVMDRSEAMAHMHHGRACIIDVEIGAERDGTVTALKVDWLQDVGAYNALNGPYIPVLGFVVSPGPYKIPHMAFHVTGVFTNRTPTDAIRGAGRPEATHYLERTMDLLARELNMDPAEVRRRNFIPKDAFPYTHCHGIPYDSGDYHAALEKALGNAGYQRLRQEQAERRARRASTGSGKLLGIGISSYVEACGLAPSYAVEGTKYGAALWESAHVRVSHTGKVTVITGSSAHGQGHETAWSQIVSDQLGVPFADVEVIHGDTGRGPAALGTYGSRSAAVGGAALFSALQKIKEKARRIAAAKLECHAEDVAFENGILSVRGAPDRSISFADVAATAILGYNSKVLAGEEPGLEAVAFYNPENFTFPFGTHICVVEVDPDDGQVEIVKYVAVDDCGNIINPLIVEGQIHGGIVFGVAQALYEEVQFDQQGQLINGTFMEYALPTIREAPQMELDNTVTPCPHHPFGVKGIGEAGTIASSAAVNNAVVDAIAHLGVRHLDMPLTPEKVWRAIESARKGG